MPSMNGSINDTHLDNEEVARLKRQPELTAYTSMSILDVSVLWEKSSCVLTST